MRQAVTSLLLFWAACACYAEDNAAEIARNETAAAASCKAFAEAEEIYHRTDYNGNGILEYAQTIHGGRRSVAKALDPATLPKPTEEDRAAIAKLIKELADDEFAVRERASERLSKIGPCAILQLKDAAKTETDAELLHRCRKLVEQMSLALAPAPPANLQCGLYSSGNDAGQEGDLCLVDRTFAKAEWPLGTDGRDAAPKAGYFFRVLTAQGAAAPGGKRNYIVNGAMTLGYAVLAFPKEYGVTGKKCFMINNNGTIYERDFGSKEKMETFVKDCAVFDPTKDWQVAE
jgi:hypothetical protein